ncbi:outer membrane biogenesis protein BamB [Botrimarina colliarenosi]|uniref:Outer membrane biogenesis protein BamB n=1 Tax=Botrimarina colliarenosi TaxID=2528001 RepID=A0A5C6AF42_9BACT|nr:PQQ-binding-like beta-propeller repeat protein [Botrimarina colliarenosi]TWT98037.1 outer membrane biogenesis protein BamB [Botrimarina colliarenosi]
MQAMKPMLLLLAGASCAASEWKSFRGDGSSYAPDAAPPTQWSVQQGENVAWTADLPGRGVSGPIVVDGRVVITASDGPRRERLHVVAFDDATGRRLWSRQAWATGRSQCHETSAVAAPTPASDGERVFAFYSSNDLLAIGLDGAVQWVRGLTLDHPGVGNDTGMASSPAVSGDAVIVQCECQNESFAIAMDRTTGATLWQVDRPREANWSSPLPWTTADGEPAVWLQDSKGASLHHANSGKQLARIDAECRGFQSPSPGSDDRLLLAAGGLSVYAAPFEQPQLVAGNLQPGSPSPVVIGDRVLVINRGGVLACGDLESGDLVWRRRLGGQFWATPVVAGDMIYCVNSKGDATVVALGNGDQVSKADFEEDILGSPAVSEAAVYFRSHAHLWKIGAAGRVADSPLHPAAAGPSQQAAGDSLQK